MKTILRIYQQFDDGGCTEYGFYDGDDKSFALIHVESLIAHTTPSEYEEAINVDEYVIGPIGRNYIPKKILSVGIQSHNRNLSLILTGEMAEHFNLPEAWKNLPRNK